MDRQQLQDRQQALQKLTELQRQLAEVEAFLQQPSAVLPLHNNQKRLGKALLKILRYERPEAWLTAQELQSLDRRSTPVEQIAAAMAADAQRFEWRLRSTSRSGWQLLEYRARARRSSGAGAAAGSGTVRPSSVFDV